MAPFQRVRADREEYEDGEHHESGAPREVVARERGENSESKRHDPRRDARSAPRRTAARDAANARAPRLRADEKTHNAEDDKEPGLGAAARSPNTESASARTMLPTSARCMMNCGNFARTNGKRSDSNAARANPGATRYGELA
jgi:hypothetical protein